jgi:hypothetical protein
MIDAPAPLEKAQLDELYLQSTAKKELKAFSESFLFCSWEHYAMDFIIKET